MTVEHLLYTPQDAHHAKTMVMLVNDDMLEKYQHGEDVDVARVVDSYDIFKYASGRHGNLVRPSKSEIESAFGTTKSDEVAEFMLKHGALHHSSRRKQSFEDKEERNEPARLHVPRSGRPL